MAWKDVTITEAGEQLLASLKNGDELMITRAGIGSGTVPVESMAEQTSITAPITAAVTLSGEAVSEDGKGKVVKIQVRNEGVAETTRMRQIAIFAKKQDTDEILFVLLQDETGEEIPAHDEFPEFDIEQWVTLAISCSNDISIAVNPMAFTPVSDFDDLGKRVKALETAKKVNVVQTTGESTEDVMSQKAVTDALDKHKGVTVVQETGESEEDVMSQKAVTSELKKLETSIDDNKVTIAQETGESTTEVMSQKAVTDALEKHKGVTVVQETGESEEDVMSQKAVTDALSESGKGFVKKEGDEMTGKLTAPTFKGDLEGNATTSTYPKGFESGDLDEVAAFLEENNLPFNEVFCFRAPANTKSPVPLEANDARRIFGCVAPGNVLNIFAEGYFNQSASLKNKSTGYAVLSRADVQNEYVTDRNYYNIYPVKVVNELFNQCEPNREYYYNFYNYYTSSATVEEKHTIHDRIGAKNGRNSKLKATLYCEINCKPTGEENYKTYAKVYDITYFPCRDYSNPSVCIINGEIIPKKEVQWSGGYLETSYQTVTYTTGEMSLEITRMESNFDLTFTLNVEALQGHEYHQIFYKSW